MRLEQSWMSLAGLWYSVHILEPISHGYWREIPPFFREMIECFALPKCVYSYHSHSLAKENSLWVNKFLLLSSNSIYNFFGISSTWACSAAENLWKGPRWNDFTLWEWESYVRSKVKGTFYLSSTQWILIFLAFPAVPNWNAHTLISLNTL